MAKKKVNVADVKMDYEAIGVRIVEAVGVPIKSGNVFFLALDSSFVIRCAEYWSGESYKRDREMELNRKKISEMAFELKHEIERFSALYGEKKDKLIVAAEKIHLDFAKATHIKPVELKIKDTATFNQWVHFILSDIFARYFGLPSKQTFNYQNSKYEGPFANYIRAVNEIFGAQIKEGTIAKIESRQSKNKINSKKS